MSLLLCIACAFNSIFGLRCIIIRGNALLMALLNPLLYLLCLVTEELANKSIVVPEPVTPSNFTRVLSNVLLPCFVNNWL